MKEQPPEERPPYDVLCEAVEDYIVAMYRRATPESVPPMIAALAEIRTAVEAGIDELLDTGQLTSPGFSTIWMMGTAHEWLEALRDWEVRHFLPQLELERERAASAEALGGDPPVIKAGKSAAVKKAGKKQAAKKRAKK
ncbi:MAG TPA: hypothetical protein VFD58_01180 [Blastocatellia bacterium]|nr:hypothetical protein [Blastocatellia bacterium]